MFKTALTRAAFCDTTGKFGMDTWFGSKQHSSNSTSSGSFGFNANLVSNRKMVARTSQLSENRQNTGKHCDFNRPHMRIMTSNSLILFRATMSLLMSYWREYRGKL